MFLGLQIQFQIYNNNDPLILRSTQRAKLIQENIIDKFLKYNFNVNMKLR